MGVTVGDYDNDGYEDIYVTNWGSSILYHNNGNGTFTDVTAKAGVENPHFGTGAAWIDYDRDGKLDLFVGNYLKFDPNAKREFFRAEAFPARSTTKAMPTDCSTTTATAPSPTFHTRRASIILWAAPWE